MKTDEGPLPTSGAPQEPVRMWQITIKTEALGKVLSQLHADLLQLAELHQDRDVIEGPMGKRAAVQEALAGMVNIYQLLGFNSRALTPVMHLLHALADLDRGAVSPLFRPVAASNADTSNNWIARAFVALAYQALQACDDTVTPRAIVSEIIAQLPEVEWLRVRASNADTTAKIETRIRKIAENFRQISKGGTCGPDRSLHTEIYKQGMAKIDEAVRTYPDIKQRGDVLRNIASVCLIQARTNLRMNPSRKTRRP